MATHSGILTWRIPWTEEPAQLQGLVPQISEFKGQLTYRVLYILQFQASTGGLGKYTPWIRGDYYASEKSEILGLDIVRL